MSSAQVVPSFCPLGALNMMAGNGPLGPLQAPCIWDLLTRDGCPRQASRTSRPFGYGGFGQLRDSPPESEAENFRGRGQCSGAWTYF